MPPPYKGPHLALAISLSLIASAHFAGCRRSVPSEFVNPQAVRLGEYGWMVMRYQDADHSKLLVASVPEDQFSILHSGNPIEVEPPFFAFDDASRSIKEATTKDWSEAKGAYVNCFAQIRIQADDVVVSENGTEMHLGGDRLPLAGRSILSYQVSPDHRLVVVVSAMGRSGFSVLPSLGQAPAAGPYYHQVFSLKEKRQIGGTVTLRDASGANGVHVCWAEKNEHVVYWDSAMRNIWVVKVEPMK